MNDAQVESIVARIRAREGESFDPKTVPVSMSHQHGFSAEWVQQPCGDCVGVRISGAPLPDGALDAAIAEHLAGCAECQAAKEKS